MQTFFSLILLILFSTQSFSFEWETEIEKVYYVDVGDHSFFIKACENAFEKNNVPTPPSIFAANLRLFFSHGLVSAELICVGNDRRWMPNKATVHPSHFASFTTKYLLGDVADPKGFPFDILEQVEVPHELEKFKGDPHVLDTGDYTVRIPELADTDPLYGLDLDHAKIIISLLKNKKLSVKISTPTSRVLSQRVGNNDGLYN